MDASESGGWADIVCADGSDEWLALCNRALKEVQDEQSRKNAKEIREHIGPSEYPGETQRVKDLVAFGLAMADLIDPNKEK